MKNVMTPKTIPVIACILWLLGLYAGYFLNKLVFTDSDAISGVTIVWALIWLCGLIFWAIETYQKSDDKSDAF